MTVELDRRAFASWIDGDWVVPPGEYTIHVGRSSADLAAPGRSRPTDSRSVEYVLRAPAPDSAASDVLD